MAYLVLVRHGQSVWNKKGLWTGLTDVPLAAEGFLEARKDGELLNAIYFDHAFTSELLRTKQTFETMKAFLEEPDLKATASSALNERDYGELTGKNKWDIEKQYGQAQFQKWRRGWNEAIAGGETLMNVFDRVIPFYETAILPLLKSNKNVLVVASGNSLRALVKYLENISEENFSSLEITVGEVRIYQVDKSGKILSHQIKGVRPNGA